MVHFIQLAATAAMSLSTAVFARPTSESPALNVEEYTHPIFIGPPSFAPSDGPAVQSITLSVEELANGTDIAPFFAGVPEAELHERGIYRRDVIGVDNRVVWSNSDYPYRAMGKIELSNGGRCSGSIIGPRHVATARHCMTDEDGVSIKFSPSYYDGDRLGHAFATLAVSLQKTQTGYCDWKEDWTILIMDQRIGDSFGYLGAKNIDAATQHNRAMFFNMGYPGDLTNGERPHRQEGISVARSDACEATGPLHTDADASRGNSGGPLWAIENGDRFQYGIASVSGAQDTVFASGTNFVSAVGRLRSEYP